MTISIANTALTNTFEFWLTQTDAIANAMSTIVMTANTAATPGNAALVGTFSAGGLYTNGTLEVANSTSNVTVSVPSTSQVSNGQYFLNANGSWVQVVSTVLYTSSVTLSGTTTQTVDSYSLSGLHAAEYMVAIKDELANNYYASKVLTTNDGQNAYMSEWAQMYTNSYMGEFSATANATTLQLQFTPVSNSVVVNFVRTGA
jgi:hypothetical protein